MFVHGDCPKPLSDSVGRPRIDFLGRAGTETGPTAFRLKWRLADLYRCRSYRPISPSPRLNGAKFFGRDAKKSTTHTHRKTISLYKNSPVKFHAMGSVAKRGPPAYASADPGVTRTSASSAAATPSSNARARASACLRKFCRGEAWHRERSGKESGGEGRNAVDHFKLLWGNRPTDARLHSLRVWTISG